MANFSYADDPALAEKLLFKGTHRVASARMRDWDYSAPAPYYVTVCTKDKRCVFGDIMEIEEEPGAKICLSAAGRIVEKCWQEIPAHYPTVLLDTVQVMPNHLHGILEIQTQRKGITLGVIINQFKTACTKKIREAGLTDFAWQERFHDHIVRNEKDLERIQTYIRNNPVMWLAGEDEEQ